MRAFSNAEMRAGRAPSFTHCFGPHPAIVRWAGRWLRRRARRSLRRSLARPRPPTHTSNGRALLRPCSPVDRDPRWGRTNEVYGEDPWLASAMAASFVKGLQRGPTAGVAGPADYLKVSATCKHAIGNDLEEWGGYTRYNFNAVISASDLRDTFWPPFEACVAAGSASIMCSYNKVGALQRGMLRGLQWGMLRVTSKHCSLLSSRRCGRRRLPRRSTAFPPACPSHCSTTRCGRSWDLRALCRPTARVRGRGRQADGGKPERGPARRLASARILAQRPPPPLPPPSGLPGSPGRLRHAAPCWHGLGHQPAQGDGGRRPGRLRPCLPEL